MKTFFLFFITLSGLLLLSCKKAGNETYTLNGRIYQNCTTTPLSNKEITFFQNISSNGLQTSGGDLGGTTTDANGNFSFTYKPQNDNDIKIQTPAGAGFATIILGVPGNENLNNLTIYYRPSTTVQVRLNVSKSYTINDTLYISDLRNSTFLKIQGPFNSSILYNASEFGILNYYYNPANYLISIGYKIGNNNSWNTKAFQLIPCDTSRVTVDIN